MTTLLEQFNNKLAELAWSLWTELGVAGTTRNHKNCLVGLEELIILTAIIAEFDPRLRDEALDWCSRYHHFVSISRLRSLVKTIGEPIYFSYSLFAETLNSIAQVNWPIFSDVKPIKVKLSGKSMSPQCNRPALFGLRLRSLYGVGARADLLTFLITHKETVFTAIDAVEIGYSKRTLAEILDGFAASGIFNATMVRNQKRYEFIKKEELHKVVGELPTIIPPWTQVIQMLVIIRASLLDFEKNSPSTNVVILRNTVETTRNLLPSIISAFPNMQLNQSHYLESCIKWIFDTLNSIAHGNFQGSFVLVDDFEVKLSLLMQDLYTLDDCLDGINFVISCSRDDQVKHSKIYKENYQLCLSYINDLVAALKKMMEFPFHQLHDAILSEIIYHFAKDKLQHMLRTLSEFPSLIDIIQPRFALKQYEILEVDLNIIQGFINQIKGQLQKSYFLRTNVHLLTLPKDLYKRHLVLELFQKAS